MSRKNEKHAVTEDIENMTYAQKLRRQEEEESYCAQQRLKELYANPKEKRNAILATFMVAAACLVFLLAGLGFMAYGITNCFDEGFTKNVLIQIFAGFGISAVTVLVWIGFRRVTK